MFINYIFWKFCLRTMTVNLEAKIEFKQLCDILERVAKEHAMKKKTQILETFIDDYRNIGKKLKTEYPESVCIMCRVKCICKISYEKGKEEKEREKYNLT